MFRCCLHLESLSMKFRSLSPLYGEFDIIRLHLPKTIKTFLLQPASNKQAMELILNTRLGIGENVPLETIVHNPVSLPSRHMLQSLTLVLDAITDELISTIVNLLPYLIHLSLEDNPQEKPSLSVDLSNTGLQSLSSSRKLTRLSLSRRRPNVFQRVTDIGAFVLAEGCKELESIRLGGFSKLTDAAYISILQSFRNLRRFEIINGYFLSDLAFHDIGSVAQSLVEVVLISCNLLTSETAKSLCSCNNLTVLDLGGCRSIADHGLNSIAMLPNLTLLDLSGADITDGGLSTLSLCSSSIDTLRLRGCKRIGDRGFKKLLRVDGTITRTLSTLDLGYLPGVSDETITWIGKTCSPLLLFALGIVSL
ncbi:F-box protein At-B [Platanthera guangdongensis]|uniref:F-box protein At-B n=1 Tax=Platanthera guangdongensis TaxID=2320717 RepID=A0ABR2LSU9_9ASPA